MNHSHRRRIHRLQQPRGAHHVGIEILIEAIEAAADGDLRREVKHPVHAGERVGHGPLVADVAVHERAASGTTSRRPTDRLSMTVTCRPCAISARVRCDPMIRRRR